VLPEECCTLSITPMLHESVRLASVPPLYPPQGPTARLVTVLLDELTQMQTEQLHLLISGHPKLRHIANALMDNSIRCGGHECVLPATLKQSK
jgi:hypothetical protein